MTSLWRNLQYVSWLVSDTSKGLAGTLFGFAVPLIALIVTDDPAQAGIIGGVGTAVAVTLKLYGGVLADRHRRITLMVLGGTVGVIISAAFTLLAFANALGFATLLVLEVLLAARSGIFDSAGEAALKDLVSNDTMGRAQAANQARDAVLQLAGGPIGGALLVAGAWLVGVVMTACHLVSAASAALIPRLRGAEIPDADEADTLPGDAVTAEAFVSTEVSSEASGTEASGSVDDATLPAKPNALREIREGFAWLFARRDLRGVLLIATVINLGVNAVFTTIIYALQQDGFGTDVIGWMSAGMGVTMLIGALVAGLAVARIGTGTLMLIGLIAFTIGSTAAIFTRDPWALVLVMALPGLLLGPLNAGLGGYFMVATPSTMMGRASSAMGVLSMGAMPLAPLVAGFGLSLLGRTGTIIIGVALCLIASAAAVMNRPLRSLPTESGWADHAKKYETGAELVEVA